MGLFIRNHALVLFYVHFSDFFLLLLYVIESEIASDSGNEWHHMGKSSRTLPLTGNNSCVPPQAVDGPCMHFSPHNSLSLSLLRHHILTTVAMAFTSPLPTGQSEGQVGNDCHIRLTPVTSASSCWSPCCHWDLVFFCKTGITEAFKEIGQVSLVENIRSKC